MTLWIWNIVNLWWFRFYMVNRLVLSFQRKIISLFHIWNDTSDFVVKPPRSFLCAPIILAYDHSAAIKQAATDAIPSARREGQITGVRLIHVSSGERSPCRSTVYPEIFSVSWAPGVLLLLLYSSLPVATNERKKSKRSDLLIRQTLACSFQCRQTACWTLQPTAKWPVRRY